MWGCWIVIIKTEIWGKYKSGSWKSSYKKSSISEKSIYILPKVRGKIMNGREQDLTSTILSLK
jgi:hypothetical protein